ncbi:hypothetical protein Chor_015042 [Crotalus horridus]
MKLEEAQEREHFLVTAAEVSSSKFLEFCSLSAGNGVIQHPFSANFPLTKHFSFPRSACSGGHYNPAVSLGAWLVGGLNMVTTERERYENATGAAFTAITSDHQLPAAVVGEIVMTMFLVMAVCMGAINEKTKSPLAPFCIGFTVTVDILAG